MDDTEIVETSDVEEQAEISLYRQSKHAIGTGSYSPRKRVKVSPRVSTICVSNK
jgi:hypothetical protein